MVSRTYSWLESSAHCDLFLNFAYAYDPFKRNQVYLEEALGEPAQKFIDSLLVEKLIELCPLSLRLSKKYKVAELKEMLKERGLKSTGKQADLIERLIDSNPEEATHLASDVQRYIWAEEGKKLAAHIIEARSSKIDAVKAALVAHDFSSAKRIASDKKPMLPISVEELWTARPGILSFLSEDELEVLRVAVGTELLLNKSDCKEFLPEDFDSGHRLSAWDAGSMLTSLVIQKNNIKRMRSAGIRRVQIIAAIRDGQCCPNCKSTHESIYAIENAPELPNPSCISPRGCHCQYVVPEGAAEEAISAAIDRL